MRLATSRSNRPGLSLLEVIVAMTIFLLALVVISRLVDMGGERALEARVNVLAAQKCEAKMSEVVAGVVALQPQGDTPFEEDADWVWSMDCEQATIAPNLWSVSVRVHRQNDKTGASLNQMVLDPGVRGNVGDAAASTSSSSSSGTTGTTSGM